MGKHSSICKMTYDIWKSSCVASMWSVLHHEYYSCILELLVPFPSPDKISFIMDRHIFTYFSPDEHSPAFCAEYLPSIIPTKPNTLISSRMLYPVMGKTVLFLSEIWEFARADKYLSPVSIIYFLFVSFKHYVYYMFACWWIILPFTPVKYWRVVVVLTRRG